MLSKSNTAEKFAPCRYLKIKLSYKDQSRLTGPRLGLHHTMLHPDEDQHRLYGSSSTSTKSSEARGLPFQVECNEHSCQCTDLRCLKDPQRFSVFLSVLIEFVSDISPQSGRKPPSKFASWSIHTPKNLNTINKSTDISIPMCLKQDSRFVFLFLEENIPRSPDPTDVHCLVF